MSLTITPIVRATSPMNPMAHDHGEEHGHDDHAHGSEELGPIDTMAWGALLLGIGLGLVVAFAMWLSTSTSAG